MLESPASCFAFRYGTSLKHDSVIYGTRFDKPQIENCSRTSAGTRTGRPVWAFIGHQSVRADDNSWPSLLLRISVSRSNVSRVALPTHVRNTTSSPRQAGLL